MKQHYDIIPDIHAGIDIDSLTRRCRRAGFTEPDSDCFEHPTRTCDGQLVAVSVPSRGESSGFG